ncbi:unnamed protein product [Rhodiola kirilowii]
MDIIFSTTPQTLIPLSPTSLRYSSSSSTCLSVARMGSIRRDFLTSSDSTRPPGVRIRRRGWSYGPKRVVVTSALSSSTVFLGVAVVSVSVAAVVMFDSMQRKKRIEEVCVRVRKDSDDEVSQRGNEISNGDKVNEKMVLLSEEVEASSRDENVGEKKVDEVVVLSEAESTLSQHFGCVSEEVQVLGNFESTLVFQDFELSPDESTETSAYRFSDVLASDIDNSVHWEESESTHLPVVFPVINNDVVHDLSAVELFNGQAHTHHDEHKVDSRSSASQSSCVSTSETFGDNLDTKQDEMKRPETEVHKEDEVESSNGFFPSSTRGDLYTLFEENRFILNGTPSSEGLVALSTNEYSGVPKQFEPSANGKSHTLELERNGATFKRSLHEGKDLENGDKGFARAKAKGLLTFTNGTHSNYDSPSDFYDGYQRLLRNGRLKDCVNLLEEMERKNLLDMNKVYHSRFFQTCKSQKSVIEAFRFANLISNPTLSTFNMLMSVCASSQDLEGAFRVLRLVQGSGLKADCKLYTTLISTCAKCGKVDRMFEVFHEMVNVKVEPNVNTYGALIDGCARAGQVPKAFGAYGIMRSKNVKPDRVVFNALITACGRSGAVDRAFDVLAEMGAENIPVEPDHVTVGALIKACANAGQLDRAREVYRMLDKYKIRGNPEVYTIAVNSFSQSGDWEFACKVYTDMKDKGTVPDEMFLSALVDVAGHAGKIDAAFEVLRDANTLGINLGIISYSSLMGACCNAKCWERALEVYEEIRSLKLKPTVATMNALITALCDGDQLQKAMEVFSDMKAYGLRPNTVTYTILSVASEKGDNLDIGMKLLSRAQEDDIVPNQAMFRGLIGMCLRRYEKAYSLGDPVMSSSSGTPQIDNKWTLLALKIYRESITSQSKPSADMVSKVLGCLQLPHDASLRNRLIENLGVTSETLKPSKLCSLLDGFGEYDPRAFSLFEEAASLGVVPGVSFKANPIVVDARNLNIHNVEVYILTVLRGLKHRLAAGARLPNINILLPVEKTPVQSSKGERTINMAARVSQKVGALLRRLGLPYQGNESYGKIRIYGLTTKRWLQPKLAIGSPFGGQPTNFSLSEALLGKKITDQQRDIRTGHLSI